MVIWFCRYDVQCGTLIYMINMISTDLDTEFNCCMVVWLNGFVGILCNKERGLL